MARLIDREKVINDLNMSVCMLCNPEMLTPEMRIRIGQAINNATKLLEEQEPVIPIKNDFEIPLTNYYGFECECTAPLMKYQPYCMKCGRAMKWND